MLVDAFVVRPLRITAVMHVLGAHTWWLSCRLGRVTDPVRI
ncbi:hypothetical protein [Cellulomonas sp. ES6]|nr:hypothetical protein [Cellulomonas sp. ES6]WHP17330.1 hypothetical protein P9841_17375 [Cellulomonas sp. ES6]